MTAFADIAPTLKPVMSGHGTFPLRLGWLKKVHDYVNRYEGGNPFGDPAAVAELGVGRTAITAMRFWSLQAHMVEKVRAGYVTTRPPALESLFTPARHTNQFYNAGTLLDDDGLDPYIESPTTVALIHLHLVTNPAILTYYWFFNINNRSSFTRHELARYLMAFMDDYGLAAPSENTVSRDITTLVQNYAPPVRKRGADEITWLTSAGQLVGLGLLSADGDEVTARRSDEPRAALSLNMFVYALLRFWMQHSPGQTTLTLDSATYAECSPGRVFMLSNEAVISYAERLEVEGYAISWVQSAGLRQFQLRSGSSLSSVFDACVKHLIAQDYGRVEHPLATSTI